MEDKIRVYNDRKYHIGLTMQNGMERVVQSGSFVTLSRDEIEYTASIAPMLFEGERQLRLSDRKLAVELGFIEDMAQPVFDESFIREQLGQRPNQLMKWLDEVREAHLLDMIYDVAMGMDLPASKLKLLKLLN